MKLRQNQVRILLIDDDEDDFVNIRGLLNESLSGNYNLSWESSYAGGLKGLSVGHFDACLLDYRLGEHTGLDLLRESQILGLDVPIVLLTGHGDFDLDVQAMQRGAADYLVKGQITAPLLERSIRYAIKRAFDVKELSEQKENFKVLFNSTYEGIVVHHKGEIVDVNAAAAEIFAYKPEEMIDTSLENYIRQDFRRKLEAQLRDNHEIRMEAIGMKKDGTEIYLGLYSRTVTLKGQSISLLAVRDLTERKQMEAQILQQDRLASLGLLASSLAHEIGTPLGVIRGRAELVAKATDDKTKATMELMVTQIDRISKLVTSLLQIARGNHSDVVTDVNLTAVIQDVLNLMSHELERKSITVKTSVGENIFVRAEAGPLGQVLLNLLVNSIHAVDEAKKKGRATGHQIAINVEDGVAFLKMSVADSGCGISEKNLLNLFKPFFTTKDIGLGTGLGLATSYKLVQSWGGSIQAESKEGEGAKFIVFLPKKMR